MCNLCHYLNTIDLNTIANSNPWSDELESPPTEIPCSYQEAPVQSYHQHHHRTSRLSYAVPDIPEVPVTPAQARSSTGSMRYPDFESFLLDTMSTSPNSYSPPHTPEEYPSFHISTTQVAPNSLNPYGPYEVLRGGTLSRNSIQIPVRRSSMAQNKLQKRRGHKRHGQVLSASTSSFSNSHKSSVRDSLDDRRSPYFDSTPSSSSRVSDVEGYFDFKMTAVTNLEQ